LREEAFESRSRVKEVEFENIQLRKKAGLIDSLYTRIETL